MMNFEDIFPTKIFYCDIEVCDSVTNKILMLGREKDTAGPDSWEGGCQSSHDHGDNKFISESTIIAQVVDAMQEIAVYNNVMKYLGDEFKYTYNTWWNYYSKGEYQEYHDHKGYSYSAVLYLTDSGSNTVFCKDGMKHHVEAKKGKLVIFPSSLPHYVQPCEEDERATIAFNFSFHK